LKPLIERGVAIYGIRVGWVNPNLPGGWEIGLKGRGDNMQLKLFGYLLGYKKCKILKAL